MRQTGLRGVGKTVVLGVEGYPYFIQLWGAELWDAAEIAEVNHLSTRLLDAARPEIYRPHSACSNRGFNS